MEQAAFSFGWGELIKFSQHLPADSATHRKLYTDYRKFASDIQRNALLADIFDAITGFAWMYSKRNGGKAQKPKPYPRPWQVSEEKHIGSKPIPISEFDKWYYGGD